MSDPLRPIHPEELPARPAAPPPTVHKTDPGHEASPVRPHPDLTHQGAAYGKPHAYPASAAPQADRVELSLRFKSILFPFEFDEICASCLPRALGLARFHGAELVVLHVLDPDADEATAEEAERRMNADLAAAVEPEIVVRTRMERGDAADTICAVAERNGCDLIVIPTHGRSGVQRMLLGSVAEHVVRAAHCPVLAIKAGQ